MKSISDVVSGAGLAGYAEVALIIFFLVFVVIGLRVLFSRKSSFAHQAHLPLDDSNHSANQSANPTRREREEQ